MTLDELCSRRVALWGIGREGAAMAALLADRGVPVTLVDDAPEAARTLLDDLGADGGETEVRPPDAVRWPDIDVVVRAPGVSRYRPELEAAREAGVVVTTPMALWLEDFSAAPVVAVTGTKGKSTTAALTAALLRHDGLDAALIGNIGTPVTEMYGRPPADAYVVEVSSYQAAEVTVSPPVTVLTSLAPDHLDWHGGLEAYYRDKLRLISAGPPRDLAVGAASVEAVWRTLGHPRRLLFGPTGRVRVTERDQVMVDDDPLGDASFLALPGRHNLFNLCGAVAGVLLLTGRAPTPGAFARVVDEFEGLPSRCRTVGERRGVTYVDDALASNPFATAASVGAFPDRELTVILGGADRGVDPGGLVDQLVARRPPPRVVVLQPDPQGLATALADRAAASGTPLAVALAGDLEEAVVTAAASTPSGGVVLFSPAAPTRPGEGGFAERSRRFATASGLTRSPDW